MNVLDIVGRNKRLFTADLQTFQMEIDDAVRSSRFLVIGGAGSIGQEVVKQIFRRQPRTLHVVDISENNLVELVRDIRSSLGYIEGDTQFLAIDFCSKEFEVFWKAGEGYDYVLNLAALKHVRSEQFVYTLLRMIETNVSGTDRSLKLASEKGVGKYFAVSSDKAKNPANLMGATKCIMEDVLFTNPYGLECSTARFANVAFSDGSLLHAFRQRIIKRQPISAPADTRRYFIIPEEAGELCLMSTVLGAQRNIFFPKEKSELKLTGFPEIARAFLNHLGYEAVDVESEEEARGRVDELSQQSKWPCFFFKSDTTGEKPFEEFYTDDDDIDWNRFDDIGVIHWQSGGVDVATRARTFLDSYGELRSRKSLRREDVVDLIVRSCPSLGYVDTGKFLNNRM